MISPRHDPTAQGGEGAATTLEAFCDEWGLDLRLTRQSRAVPDRRWRAEIRGAQGPAHTGAADDGYVAEETGPTPNGALYWLAMRVRGRTLYWLDGDPDDPDDPAAAQQALVPETLSLGGVA